MTTTTSGPPTSSNRVFVLIVVALIVVGLAGVAILATQRDSVSSDVSEQQTAAVTIDGDGLAAMPADVQVSTVGIDPAVGATAPALTGTDFEDNEVTIGADGRAKVIYFLAHWCPHCQAEVPVVQELIDEGSLPDGLDIYAVSTAVDEGRGNYPPQIWLDREDFTPMTMRDDDASSALAAFGGGGFPYAVYLDGNNTVVARSAGELGKDAISGLWQTTAEAAALGGGTDDGGSGSDADSE